jgi:hypothetical protein
MRETKESDMVDALAELHGKRTLIKDRVRAVVHGHATGLYLYGRPGTSKTYTVRTMLGELSQPHAYDNGHLTPVGLFGLIRDNPQSVIVLDDVSSLFAQPVALQILLACLGNPPDGSRDRTVRYKTAHTDEIVRFSGGIIAISNLPLAGHNREVLAALQDRVHVVGYEPTDEQMEAFIYEIADTSPRGVSVRDARMVAHFLLEECRKSETRPSVRLFMDKALPDYCLWREQKSESHWKDLVRSSLQQEAIPHGLPLRDVSRKERKETEQRLVLSLLSEFPDGSERLEAWKERTGKGKSAFYRRHDELKEQGMIAEA